MARLGSSSIYGDLIITGKMKTALAEINGYSLDDISSGEPLNSIAVIKSDSVMEIGRYIDMHTSGSVADYDIRLDCESADVLNIVGGVLEVGGSRVLTQADEGSGNGIDADTLDTLQGSQFLRSDTTDTATGSIRFSNATNYFGGTAANTAEIWMQTGNAGSPQIGLTDNQGDMSWAIGGDDQDNYFKIHGNANATVPTINAIGAAHFAITTGGNVLINNDVTSNNGFKTGD